MFGFKGVKPIELFAQFLKDSGNKKFGSSFIDKFSIRKLLVRLELESDNIIWVKFPGDVVMCVEVICE